MNIWGLENKLKEINRKIKIKGETLKLKRMKMMYKNLIKQERENKKSRRKKK